MEDEPQFDRALRAANVAIAGQRRREASRFASIELRFTDPQVGPWEMAALSTVAFAAVLFVLGMWFL